MKEHFRVAELITKYVNEELTEDERRELEDWVSESDENLQFFLRFDDPRYVAEELRMMDRADTSHALEKTMQRIAADESRMRVSRPWGRLVAAAVLLVMATGAFFLFRPRQRPMAGLATTTERDFAPGGDRAILTLSGGHQVVLDSAGDGALARQGNVEVLKEGGRLTYRQAPAASASSGETAYNTISTPRGGQYALILQDGTRIWLNAASRLRFPVNFGKGERLVELQGEAYFEVAKNKAMPFKVLVSQDPGQGGQHQLVQVLGTNFNVMAYPDEPQIRTSLLEGSVQVVQQIGDGGRHPVILKPGQQAQLSKSGDLQIDGNADMEQAVAWKNGLQSFHNADIRTIMRQVSRWYNVDVRYEGEPPPGIEITGKIPRSITMQQLLKALDLNSQVHFKMEAGVVTVMPTQ